MQENKSGFFFWTQCIIYLALKGLQRYLVGNAVTTDLRSLVKNCGDAPNTLVCKCGKEVTKNEMSTPWGLHFTPVQCLPPLSDGRLNHSCIISTQSLQWLGSYGTPSFSISYIAIMTNTNSSALVCYTVIYQPHRTMTLMRFRTDSMLCQPSRLTWRAGWLECRVIDLCHNLLIAWESCIASYRYCCLVAYWFVLLIWTSCSQHQGIVLVLECVSRLIVYSKITPTTWLLAYWLLLTEMFSWILSCIYFARNNYHSFYRAMLCIAQSVLWQDVCPSVRSSVTRR